CDLRSRGRRNYGGVDIHPPPPPIKAHATVNQSKNCVIPTEPAVFSRQKIFPPLAHDDVAGPNRPAAQSFHAQPFANAIATVLDAALSFFMSHDGSLMFEG